MQDIHSSDRLGVKYNKSLMPSNMKVLYLKGDNFIQRREGWEDWTNPVQWNEANGHTHLEMIVNTKKENETEKNWSIDPETRCWSCCYSEFWTGKIQICIWLNMLHLPSKCFLKVLKYPQVQWLIHNSTCFRDICEVEGLSQIY